ncbi:hypothetical protein ACQP1G_42470 [Nocardia sp. CA-107356]|uniref:hypothetical protein n=1 Tax=Nocardia sp. CA-107356 TaxID=3239972 RepID=UPI003D948164
MTTTPTPPRRLLEDQLDTAWLDWMSDKHTRLNTFFSHDVPAMPEDRHSTAGLRTAEHALLTRFATFADAAPGDDTLARFGCYLGEVFVESLDGYWINEPFPNPAVPRATVRFEYTDVRLCVHEHVVLALHHRSGSHWQHMHAVLSAQCAAWWESGRSTR